MDAAIAGFLGTALAAFASGVGVSVQQNFQSRRKRQGMAVDVAMQENSHALELAQASKGVALVAPLARYIICSADLLEAIAEGVITPEKM